MVLDERPENVTECEVTRGDVSASDVVVPYDAVGP